jgi:hypothetical protein
MDDERDAQRAEQVLQDLMMSGWLPEGCLDEDCRLAFKALPAAVQLLAARDLASMHSWQPLRNPSAYFTKIIKHWRHAAQTGLIPACNHSDVRKSYLSMDAVQALLLCFQENSMQSCGNQQEPLQIELFCRA